MTISITGVHDRLIEILGGKTSFPGKFSAAGMNINSAV